MDAPEMAAIDARFAELEDNKLALEEAAFNPPAGGKRLPRERYWELRTQIEQEQEQLQRRCVVNREVEPLKAALKQTWTIESWCERPLEYRRAIIKLVIERLEVVTAWCAIEVGTCWPGRSRLGGSQRRAARSETSPAMARWVWA